MYDYSKENEERDKIKTELNKFNWGAFCFGWIWALCNGAWNDYFPTLLIMIAAVAISKIPLIGPVFRLLCPAITIYIGTKGNEWAYNGTKKWKSFESFVETQRKWGAACIIYFVVLVLGFVTYMSICLYYNTNHIPQRNINKTVINELIADKNFSKLNSANDIVKYLSQKNPNVYTVFNDDSVLVKPVKGDEYVLQFFRFGTCSLARYNCYVFYNTKEGNDLKVVLKTFFDEQGNIKHFNEN